jgi:hypothetical protein
MNIRPHKNGFLNQIFAAMGLFDLPMAWKFVDGPILGSLQSCFHAIGGGPIAHMIFYGWENSSILGIVQSQSRADSTICAVHAVLLLVPHRNGTKIGTGFRSSSSK